MTNNFVQQVTQVLSSYGRIEPVKFDTPFLLLSVHGFSTLFHLITLQPVQDPLFFQNMTLFFYSNGDQIVHLWEDRWLRQQSLLEQIIHYKLGKCQRIFARHTRLEVIHREIALTFLHHYHLLSGVKSRYHLGLYCEEKLLAVASFSNQRKLTYTLPHRTSYELVRYATLPNMMVVGGLSKILRGFIHLQQPDHIMTYCDMDFGMGCGFQKTGFTITHIMPPLSFSIDTSLVRHYNAKSNDEVIYYNAGNVKLAWQLVV